MARTKAIPDGYHSVTPYLIAKNCSGAIDFYAKAFGAKERLRVKRADGRIGHAEIQIGDSCVMLADEHPEIGALSPEHYGGSPISLHVYVEDCDGMYQRALAAGAKSLREPVDQPYGDRTCGVLDPFGYRWWFATHVKDVPKQELEKLG
jgi:PhnB protein